VSLVPSEFLHETRDSELGTFFTHMIGTVTTEQLYTEYDIPVYCIQYTYIDTMLGCQGILGEK
jgi:hypothetical protein